MIFVYLIFGIAMGGLAAGLTLTNGGGVLLALLAYSAGGAMTILMPLMVHATIAVFKVDDGSWDDRNDQNDPISA